MIQHTQRTGRPPIPRGPAAAAATIAAALVTAPAWATEGGGTVKIPGIETVLAGYMAPQGQTRMLLALGRYRSSHTLDGNGQPRANLSNFDLTVSAVTLRMQYVWPGVQLLGADVESRIGYAFLTETHLAFDVGTPGGPVHRDGSAHGPGDLLLAPVTLGWHHGRWHQMATVEFFVATGRFAAGRLVNQSRGYLGIVPTYRFTWLPDMPLEVSGNLVYIHNRINPDTGVRSGRELSFDYGVGWTVAPGWQVGASGYVYRQIGDDLLNGVRVPPDGNRGRVTAAGPFVRYFIGNDFGITFKWQAEQGVRNRTDGNRFFVQMTRSL